MKLRKTSIVCGLLRNRRGSVQSASFGRRIVELVRSDSSGSALVELAFALPAYLILITCMVSTVMALYSYQQLAFATFAASEAIGANRGKLVGDDPCLLAANQLASSLPTWTPGNFTITVWITQNVAGKESPKQFGPYAGLAAATCSSNGVNPPTPGTGSYAWDSAGSEPVTVRASYNYTWFPVYSNAITTGPLVAAETSFIR
jgi:hypothetical protein